MTAPGARLESDDRRPASWATTAFLLLMAPALVILGVLFVVPLADVVTQSFTKFSLYAQGEGGWTLENYRTLYSDAVFRLALVRTLQLSLAVSVVSCIVGFPMAYAIARSPGWLASTLTAIVLVPLMTSVVIRTYGWMIILGESGPLPSLVAAFGLPRPRLMYTFWGTVIALAQVLMPFLIMTVVGSLKQIDPRLIEASRSLGAGRVRAFTTILLPLCWPGIASGLVLVFALSMTALAAPLLIGGSRFKVIASVIYEQALAVFNWSFASAVSLVVLVMALTLALLQEKLSGWVSKWRA